MFSFTASMNLLHYTSSAHAKPSQLCLGWLRLWKTLKVLTSFNSVTSSSACWHHSRSHCRHGNLSSQSCCPGAYLHSLHPAFTLFFSLLPCPFLWMVDPRFHCICSLQLYCYTCLLLIGTHVICCVSTDESKPLWWRWWLLSLRRQNVRIVAVYSKTYQRKPLCDIQETACSAFKYYSMVNFLNVYIVKLLSDTSLSQLLAHLLPPLVQCVAVWWQQSTRYNCISLLKPASYQSVGILQDSSSTSDVWWLRGYCNGCFNVKMSTQILFKSASSFYKLEIIRHKWSHR